MNLSDIQQAIADQVGIDANPNMTADQRANTRKTSDLQTVIAFKWDQENGHPADTPASRRACARYVRQNVRRIRREQRQQQQDAVDSRTDPSKCKFIFLAFLIEAFFSWLFGRFMDAWWDNRNKIDDPNPANTVALMLIGGGEPAWDVVENCQPVDESQNDDEADG